MCCSNLLGSVRMNLSLAQCRGQCYDGAAVMQGRRNGVAVQILQVRAPGRRSRRACVA